MGKRAYVHVANPTSGARNPGFDVTPADLITGIIKPAEAGQALRPGALAQTQR
jgi:methylthioribose-1-phosphate isomerase